MAAPAPATTAPPPPPRPPRRGPWQTVTQLSARTPLRIKLITALLALVTIALVCISVAGVFVFRSYLRSNTDNQVRNLFYSASGGAQRGNPPNPNGGISCAQQYLEAFVPTGHKMSDCVDARGARLPAPEIPTSADWLKSHSGQLVTLPSTFGGDSWRVLTEQETYTVPGLGQYSGTLIAAEDLGNISQSVNRLVSIDLIVGAIVVLGLAVVGVAVVRTNLQPLTEIERTAGEIAAGDLSKRVTERDPGTEVGSLGRSLNAMLAQIEAAFRSQAESEATARLSENRMRQFAADASHELRTPLTAIKGYAEYYRQRGGSAAAGTGPLESAELDRIMTRVEDEATRMGGLVEDLLLLARIDQQRPLEHLPVDLLALAADAVQDARMIAPARTIGLTVGRGTAFLVMGDEARLRQVIGNLMSNALNHTPDGTPIEVNVRSGSLGGWGGSQQFPAVLVEVVDHGPGMTTEQARRVFERFYRADQARTRATGGTGLGLAIVSALVSAHGGTVYVDTAPGRGATFRVTLPLAPEAQGGDDSDDGDEPLASTAASPSAPAQPASAPGPYWGPAPPGQPGETAPGLSANPAPEQPAGDAQPDMVEKQSWRPFS